MIIKERKRENMFYGISFSSFCTKENDIVSNGINNYLNIPQNKVAYDFIYKKCQIKL
jgi:hypothetical protein